MVASAFVCLALAGLPDWVPIIVVARELIVFGGWCLLRLFEKPAHVRPSPLGKWTTFVQFGLLTGGLWKVLVGGAATLEGDPLFTVASVGVVGLTAVSGLMYVREGLRRFESEVPAAHRDRREAAA